MLRSLRTCLALAPWCALLLLAPAPSFGAPDDTLTVAPERSRGAGELTDVADSTWVDHDQQAIRRPPERDRSYWGRRVHQGLTEPLAHAFDIPDKLLWLARVFGVSTRREAVNANAFDEAPNSSWFTNRNHVRAVPVADLRQGPDSVFQPAKPWIIKHTKQGGWSPGFQIKDASGRKWLVKLDMRGYPQLSSGADMVARTLFHAAGYNVPHNEPVRFVRGDFTIDPDLLSGAKGERLTPADLDSLLAQGATLPDGAYLASASLFIDGHVLGSPSMVRSRPGDSNDWYRNTNRREIRGLYVVCSWLNDWDTEDHQFLDTFVEGDDSLGHVEHYILDAGSTFGAAAAGPKEVWEGYEHAVDLGWTSLRFVSLGFVEEPWRRAKQDTGIPSIGIYESAVYEPQKFRSLVPHPAFRLMTDRDGYWGAKIVASFSDAQIAAAVQSAHYDDPRTSVYLVHNLIVRRDKIASYWFGRVAPLDFFDVQEGALRFHDLAVDIGLAGERSYDLEVEPEGGQPMAGEHVHLERPELPLDRFGPGVSRIMLQIAVAGSRAKPTRVELARDGTTWKVTHVRHGSSPGRATRGPDSAHLSAAK
jgi:hypothetical protein